jgi:hypothetical protein
MKVAAILALGLMAVSAEPQHQIQADRSEILATPTTVTPLSDSAILALSETQTLHLEPGVRMNRVGDGYLLSTFDGHKIELSIGSDVIALPSPALVRAGASGWDFGTGKTTTASSVVAKRRQNQDDTDQNLKSMQEAARKLKNRQDARPSSKQAGRWANQENPFATAELFNKPAIQQLTHLSAAGF